MRLMRLLLATFVLCAPSAAFAQEWVEFMSSVDRFSITFPSQPTVEEIKWNSEYGAVFPGRVYTARQGPSTYTVTVIDQTQSEKIHAAIAKPDSFTDPRYWQIDIQGAIQWATTTKYRQRAGSKVTYDAWHYIDLVEGHMIQLLNSDNTRTFASIYLHENRLYIVDATVPQNYPPPGLFQQNLSFLDENGRRVRYNQIYSNRLPVPADGGAGRGGGGRGGGLGIN
jgi:hypothetical protein